VAGELDALIAALRSEREATDRRLAELELRVADLEAPAWMTLAEAAEHLRTSADALQKRASRGQLPGAVKDNGRWLVDRRALDADLGATVRVTEKSGPAPCQRPDPWHREIGAPDAG
jgi:Helix-turn-helix domain